jgi:chorismate synthase
MTLHLYTSGESHGPVLTAILEGMPAGLPLSAEALQPDLARRQHGYGAGARMALEHDTARILGGVMDGVTTGAPLAIQIENTDHARWRGKAVSPFTIPRPGHADLVGAIKYGYSDLRPALERASARETAARVAAGAVCRLLLALFDIRVGGYVCSIGEVDAILDEIPLAERFSLAAKSEVNCPDPQASRAMQARIYQVMQEKDTLGRSGFFCPLGAAPGLAPGSRTAQHPGDQGR